MDTKEKIKKALDELVSLGTNILYVDDYRHNKEKYEKGLDTAQKKILTDAEVKHPLNQSYQDWYSKALKVVSQLAPDRYEEFSQLYRTGGGKKVDVNTYGISNYLQGFTLTAFESRAIFSNKFSLQISILKSIKDRVDDVLSNLSGLLQANLFDNELEAAQELAEKGHSRAAGVLCGVVLEGHLLKVCETHQISNKKDSTISTYNDSLKDADVIDVPTWRRIQSLGDIRNLCGHKKTREPTKEEVADMINGTKRVIKEVF